MKQVEFHAIGTYELIQNDEQKNQITITLKKTLKEALIQLKHFSHCMVFTKQQNELYVTALKLMEVNEKKGILMVTKVNESDSMKGELVDLKPYFPCEECVEEKKEAIKFDVIKSSHENAQNTVNGMYPIGEYVFAEHEGWIQFNQTQTNQSMQATHAFSGIKPGDYVRILWWFHKFDHEKYRSHLMCNPPYKNAPKCGVFATRSPVRPNPLASTVVKVKAVDLQRQRIAILGFDGFEHSIILQMMPYDNLGLNEYVIESDVRVPQWVEHWTNYKTFNEPLLIPVDTNASISCASISCHSKVIDFSDGDIYCAELEEEKSDDLESLDDNIIRIENACIHNLKNVTVSIPKEKITVITGVSGSGKSSLAFDTLYHESQKQFIDLVASHSPLGVDLKESKVKKITGLQPAIAIEQKNLGSNPRSTVASVTKIGDYLRLLFSTIGERVCPNCHECLPENQVCGTCGTIGFEMTPALFNYNHPEYMCPVCKGLGEEYQIDLDRIISHKELSLLDGASDWWGNLRKHRERPNANWMKGEVLALAEALNEDLEVPYEKLSDAFKQQVLYGSNGQEVTLHYDNPNGRSGSITRPVEGVVNSIKRLLADQSENKSMDHIERFMTNKKCSRCNGERLLEEGRLVRIGQTRYPEATTMSIAGLRKWCHATYNHLNSNDREKCKGLFIKIIAKLKKLEQVGLSYLTLDRSMPSLSGGEAQRLKIATQFGSGLSNILYIMDEPSKGLHPKDFKFLIDAICELKKQKNTIVIVEHKNEFVRMADYLIEIGPGAGHYGGQLLRAECTSSSEPVLTIQMPEIIKKSDFISKCAGVQEQQQLTLQGAKTHNLKNVEVSIPLKKFTCVIGVSGSGKSSLISKTLYPAVMQSLGNRVDLRPEYNQIIGLEQIKEICYVNQKAIGKNSRSNPGTYTGVFDLIRDFYANLEAAKVAKLTKEHFSFNSVKGQCPECKGAGEIAIPMHFMPDINILCGTCGGERYQAHILEIKYMGYSISDLLNMEIGEVKALFVAHEKIDAILNRLCQVGLSYLKLGQNAATLSGGEAQRIKLAKALSEGKTKDTLYIMDEPTTGLHEEDVKKIAHIIRELTLNGATVIVIEHNPQLISQADYIIEMGPVGGDDGGYVLREGWQKYADLKNNFQ